MVYPLFVLALQPSYLVVIGLWAVHIITCLKSTSSIHLFFYKHTFWPIFLNMVFPFRWLVMEFIGMSHDLLTFLRECVPLSTTSIVIYSISFVHMPFLVFGGTRFSCGVDILFCGSKVKGSIFLISCKVYCYACNGEKCVRVIDMT